MFNVGYFKVFQKPVGDNERFTPTSLHSTYLSPVARPGADIKISPHQHRNLFLIGIGAAQFGHVDYSRIAELKAQAILNNG